MLEKIVRDTARLIAKWQAFGFNHGVMNTDNMSIHGITFDNGPYACVDDFEPSFICNHSVPQGRYSFDSQLGVGLWNLNALAQAFTPHLEVEQIKQALSHYEPNLLKEYSSLEHHKLGLIPSAANSQTDSLIINTWLDILTVGKSTTAQPLERFVSSTVLLINKNCETNSLIVSDLMSGPCYTPRR